MDSVTLLNSLIAEVAELKKELMLYKNKYAEAMQAYEHLLHQYKELQRYRFGKRSERDTQAEADGKSKETLGEGDNSGEESQETTSEESVGSLTETRNKKSKKKSRDFFVNLQRREVIIPVEQKQCLCCGQERVVIRHETTELLNHVPSIFEIIVQKREVVACKNNCEQSIFTAPNRVRLLPRSCVTNDFLSLMIVSKLYDRQPLYHLEKKFIERFSFICSRAKLARWFIDSAEKLHPLINLMQDEIRTYDVAACDPTHLQVLKEPGRKAETKSYVFCIRGGEPDKSVILYQYNAKGHKNFLTHFFEGFRGYLHVDGQNIFDELAEDGAVQLVYCNSHARRKFEPIAKAAKKPGLAVLAMEHYKKLYKIEREAKDNQMTPTQRFQLRQEKSKPLIDTFEAWLEEMVPTTLPQSSLHLAFDYTLKRKEGLRRFLIDGRLEVDNNGTEQKIKDFALQRNNFLFAYSVAGANALCIHQSLIVTAVAHKLDPYAYYCYILQRIPYCKTIEDFETLLPWNVARVLPVRNLEKAA
jgi:transposase